MEEIKVGSQVKWLDSPYEVVEIKKTGLMLKQKFSIATTLTSPVKTEEVLLIK
jgi:hypothetical protein